MNKLVIVILFISFAITLSGQSSYYVSQQDGSDDYNGASVDRPFLTVDKAVSKLEPGDTLYFIGHFTNKNFDPNYRYLGNIDDPYIWRNEHTIRISNLNGSTGKYITLKAYDDNTVLIGDASNILRMTNCSYITIEDFDMRGQNEAIPTETALALQFLYKDGNVVKYRVSPGTSDEEVENMTFPVLGPNIQRPSYTDTRGLYLSNVHHIDILNNTIHHVPGNGFRVADCDYINIIGNEVYETSVKSYSGTHGLVVTGANSFDDEDGYKIVIANNLVHHNYNEIYSWSPQKDIITPRIDEGKGISMQRNSVSGGWTHGRFLIANNIAYWNGFSGVHSNTGARMDYINNTCFMNSYTSTVTYANDPINQKGNQLGISSQSGEDIRIYNNIVVFDPSWGGFGISIVNTPGLEISNNLTYGLSEEFNEDPDVTMVEQNAIKADPLFLDPTILDFRLTKNSPAIGMADASLALPSDFANQDRDQSPDMGALEYVTITVAGEVLTDKSITLYPNPCRNVLFIEVADIDKDRIIIADISGRPVSHMTDMTHTDAGYVINTSKLPIGYYIIHLGGSTRSFVKY